MYIVHTYVHRARVWDHCHIASENCLSRFCCSPWHSLHTRFGFKLLIIGNIFNLFSPQACSYFHQQSSTSSTIYLPSSLPPCFLQHPTPPSICPARLFCCLWNPIFTWLPVRAWTMLDAAWLYSCGVASMALYCENPSQLHTDKKRVGEGKAATRRHSNLTDAIHISGSIVSVFVDAIFPALTSPVSCTPLFLPLSHSLLLFCAATLTPAVFICAPANNWIFNWTFVHWCWQRHK